MLQLQDIKLIKKKKQIVSLKELEVERGKVTGIIGPNGAGKSSLLKIMALLDPPTSGIIQLDGSQVFPGKISLVQRRKVAVVFQQPLMLDTTVYQNVAIGLKFRKLSKNEIKKKVHFWLKQFGVEHLLLQRARTLSGGEAQRVSIARAMAIEPEVLFLDEPFSALDLPTRRKLLKDFKQILKTTKTTTIFISHDYHEVQFLCDEIILMYGGKMVDKILLTDLQPYSFQKDFALFLDDWMTPLIDHTK